jgi:ferrochelatase
MPTYRGEPDFSHQEQPAIGVLFSNLGTPQAPTAAALRPYLREFLWDPRVIEYPRLLWWLILNVIVLTFRPRKSAALYRSVWTPEGSPLLAITRRQAAGLAARLSERQGAPVHVAVGMRYGQPSVAGALAELAAKGCRRLLVLPMYPQYSATTTGSTFDEVVRQLSTWRWVPELRTIHGFHDDPGYVASLASSIRELWQREGEPDRLLLSFHGMPIRYFHAGDPYFCFCQKTARLVREALGLAPERLLVTFQSRFGSEPWLQPYTDKTLEALPAQGVERVDVACPGFSADCLETLEEINGLNREVFLHAGGKQFRYIACLNDRADHLDALADVVERHLQGWLQGWSGTSGEAAAVAARATAERSSAMADHPSGRGTASPRGRAS